MTPIERRRCTRVNRARRWLTDFTDRWRDVITLVMGTVLIVLSVVVVLIALSIRSQSISDKHASENAQRTSHAACVRTRAFAPALADAYARYRILTPDQVAAYRSSIPVSCP